MLSNQLQRDIASIESTVYGTSQESVFRRIKIALAEAQNTPTNSRSTPCNCGNQAVVHFCQACLKTHDEYCKVPF